MRIAVAFKAVPDAQDVQVAGDRTLDFSKAKLTISEYDKNALELGAQLADEAVAITVGGKDIDNSKLKKDVMARGMGHLYMAADDALADLDEGADCLIVKPAGPYMDIIRQVRDAVDVPLCAYQVSGEYSMIRAAGLNGWINEEAVMMESLLGMKRAGAKMLITYFTETLLKQRLVR